VHRILGAAQLQMKPGSMLVHIAVADDSCPTSSLSNPIR
jgi:hypothetical protein